MTKINKEILALIDEAVELEDQTQTTGGDFEYAPPPAGLTVGRFIEYIELGEQPQKPWKGQPKKPIDEVRLTFELLSPAKNIREIEVDGVKKKVADRYGFTLPKSFNEKSKFYKLFNKMAYGRDSIKHMAQMLGEAFTITVEHNVVEKDGNKRTYVNIRNKAGEYLIGAPVQVNHLTGESKPLNVPEALSPIKLFLFNKPTKATWDSLFIDGDRTKKDGEGNEVTETKNWLQEKILGASNYEGSALSELLEGYDELTIEDEIQEEVEEASDDLGLEEEVVEETPAPKKTVATVGKKAAPAAKAPAKAAVAKPAAKTTPAKTTVAKAAPKKAVSSDDALAALGLA